MQKKKVETNIENIINKGMEPRHDFIDVLADAIEKDHEREEQDRSLLDDIKNMSDKEKEAIKKELGLDTVEKVTGKDNVENEDEDTEGEEDNNG